MRDPNRRSRALARRRRGSWLLRVVGLAVACWSAGGTLVAAHTGGSTGYATLTVSRNTVRYSLSLVPATLPARVAEEFLLARSGRVESRERLLGHIRRKLVLEAQGQVCEPAGGFVEAPRAYVESVTLVVDFVCASPVRELAVRDDLYDLLGPDHHTLAKVEAQGSTQQFAFATEAREARFALGGGETSGQRAGWFRLGVAHILSGYDHLLFLGALLIRGGPLWSLLKIVTTFTLAHSVTLALAVLGVLAIPARLVEPAIAASIVWVAAENLLSRGAPPRRALVSFLFGLVHGLGFASGLGPLELPRWSLAVALVGFNLGVETGQGVVVLAALPLLVWLEKHPWEPQVVRAASLALAAVGFAWFVERLLFA